jgi:hypothetical protein
MTSREDLETAVLLLVGKAAERALSKPKNRIKLNVPDLDGCLDALKSEGAEVEEARWLIGCNLDSSDPNGVESVIDELGDVIATAGLALWRAHGGKP